jgi:plasmid maintenance system killer protein
MNIEFENEALEELYIKGTTQDQQYKRLSKDIIKRYVKVVNYLRGARRLEDLFLIKSLHYEKKKVISMVWMLFGLMISIDCSSILHPMRAEL